MHVHLTPSCFDVHTGAGCSTPDPRGREVGDLWACDRCRGLWHATSSGCGHTEWVPSRKIGENVTGPMQYAG
jgi:hypothetical protein